MRKILRAAGGTARVFLFVVKCLLLILAVGVLVLWPMSRGKFFNAHYIKYTVRPDRVDEVVAGIECENGRIIASHQAVRRLAGGMLAIGRQEAAHKGEAWKWETTSGEEPAVTETALDRKAPLRWEVVKLGDSDYATEIRAISAPCWLIAPLLALWPLVSIVLFVRRRTRLRRRIASGCCLSCGYDLRATPFPGGEILARCPECGAEDQTPGSEGANVKLEDR